MESYLLTIIDALRINVFACYMMILDNTVKTDYFLNNTLFNRLTAYLITRSQLKFTPKPLPHSDVPHTQIKEFALIISESHKVASGDSY